MAVPRWLRVIRGMIGTGLTFTAVVGAVGLLVGVPARLSRAAARRRASLDSRRGRPKMTARY